MNRGRLKQERLMGLLRKVRGSAIRMKRKMRLMSDSENKESNSRRSGKIGKVHEKMG